MRRRTFIKGAAFAAAVAASVLTGCGSKSNAPVANEDGVVESTEQTRFTIIGGQSALSPGYAGNQVLNEMQENAGIAIEWNTMSDSLAEQVNIRIAGGDWPDAFMGVGFSNYDLTPSGNALQTDFRFERINNWSGFINKSFYFIHFTPYMTTQKIKE